MKKNLFVMLILTVVVVVAPMSAQESQAFVAPWGPPVPGVEAGKSLIAVGFFAEVIGFGLIAGASAGYSVSYDFGSALMGLGTVSMVLIGHPLFQLGLGQHHDDLVEQGYLVPDEHRLKSRRLGLIALGCEGGAVVTSILALATDSLALGITSFVLGGSGMVIETINLFGNKRNWIGDMKHSAGLEFPTP